jgi:segregation and condensation protein A
VNISDKYVVTIDNFDGPLDLLLHLIKEQDIDIYDIKIEDITKQYLDYIRHMKELNLEIASEYLVMASELIEMKSKMLLPKKKEKEDDDYEEDPRELLIERLLAYKRYKEVTSEFKDLELTRKMVFTREPDNLNRYVKEDENSEELGVADLIDAFNNLLKRKELDRPIATKITKKELSVTEKVNKIKNILRNKKKINFEDIFEVSTKEEVIISFLSVLEMVKKDEILLTQEGNFKNIVISLKEGE